MPRTYFHRLCVPYNFFCLLACVILCVSLCVLSIHALGSSGVLLAILSPTCYSIEITVGVAFKNDTLGWTSKASGSSYPQIVRTEDGGSTWTPINQTGTFSIVTAIAASRGQDIDVQVFGVPVSFQVQRKIRWRSMFDSRVSFKT